MHRGCAVVPCDHSLNGQGPRERTGPPYLRPMHRTLIVLAAWMPILLFGQAPTKQEVKVRRQLDKGKAYAAIRNATAMVLKGTHPEFLALRAEGYNAIGEFSKAEADARSAMQLLPGRREGLLQLALAEQGLGRLDSAAHHLRQVLGTGADAEVRYRLALVEMSRGQLGAAMTEIDRALAMAGAPGPQTARLHRVKGEVAAMAGDSLLARQQLDSAVALAPDDPVNYNSRGYYAHAWRGEHGKAIADYSRAIRLNPNYSYAFNNRGWSRYKLGEKDKALKDIGQAKRRKASNPFIYRNLGVIALESGDTAKACMLFRQALDWGFTASHGPEVEQRISACCGKLPVPVQPPATNARRPETPVVPRSNAPE